MVRKDIISLVNEEISNFDYLGNQEHEKWREEIETLRNRDFQKRFISDSILGNERVKVTAWDEMSLTDNWNDSDEGDTVRIDVDGILSLEYRYDTNKPPIQFDLHFQAQNVGNTISTWRDRGSYDTQPTSGGRFDSVSWEEVEVTIFSRDGETIEFKELNAVPDRIRNLFVRHYLENYLKDVTGMR